MVVAAVVAAAPAAAAAASQPQLWRLGGASTFTNAARHLQSIAINRLFNPKGAPQGNRQAI